MKANTHTDIEKFNQNASKRKKIFLYPSNNLILKYKGEWQFDNVVKDLQPSRDRVNLSRGSAQIIPTIKKNSNPLYEEVRSLANCGRRLASSRFLIITYLLFIILIQPFCKK